MSLTQQLSERARKSQGRLQFNVGPGGYKPTFRVASLLYPEKAANISLETIYNLGVNGFYQLCRMEGTFKQFEDPLFGKDAKEKTRKTLDAEETQQVDTLVDSFLLHLSPFLLHKCAQKALEWLLRRYDIHVHNEAALIRCALPFHETKMFPQVARVIAQGHKERRLSRKGNIERQFDWVRSCQAQPIKRVVLVNLCVKETSLLDFLCDMARRAASSLPKKHSSTYVRFYGAVVVECLARVSPAKNEMVQTLLPYIVHGVRSRVLEYQLASYMIICALSAGTVLARPLASELITALCKSAKEAGYKEALLAVVYICQSQPLLSGLSVENVAALTSFPLFVDLLVAACAEYECSNFLVLLTRNLLEKGPENRDHGDLLQAIVEHLPVRSLVPSIVSTLLFKKLRGELEDTYVRVFRVLDSRYPREVDQGINNAMALVKGDEEDRSVLASLVVDTFGAHHSPVQGGSTLLLALRHPEASVRVAALDTLERGDVQAVLTGLGTSNIGAGELLRCLEDDDCTVVLRALSLQDALAPHADPEEHFEKLRRLASLRGPDGFPLTLGESQREIQEKALEALAGPFLEVHGGFAGRVLPVVVEALVVASGWRPSSSTLTCSAARAILKCREGTAGALVYCNQDALRAQLEAFAEGRGEGGSAALVRAVVSAMADAVALDPAGLVPAVHQSLSPPSGSSGGGGDRMPLLVFAVALVKVASEENSAPQGEALLRLCETVFVEACRVYCPSVPPLPSFVGKVCRETLEGGLKEDTSMAAFTVDTVMKAVGASVQPNDLPVYAWCAVIRALSLCKGEEREDQRAALLYRMLVHFAEEEPFSATAVLAGTLLRATVARPFQYLLCNWLSKDFREETPKRIKAEGRLLKLALMFVAKDKSNREEEEEGEEDEHLWVHVLPAFVEGSKEVKLAAVDVLEAMASRQGASATDEAACSLVQAHKEELLAGHNVLRDLFARYFSTKTKGEAQEQKNRGATTKGKRRKYQRAGNRRAEGAHTARIQTICDASQLLCSRILNACAKVEESEPSGERRKATTRSRSSRGGVCSGARFLLVSAFWSVQSPQFTSWAVSMAHKLVQQEANKGMATGRGGHHRGDKGGDGAASIGELRHGDDDDEDGVDCRWRDAFPDFLTLRTLLLRIPRDSVLEELAPQEQGVTEGGILALVKAALEASRVLTVGLSSRSAAVIGHRSAVVETQDGASVPVAGRLNTSVRQSVLRALKSATLPASVRSANTANTRKGLVNGLPEESGRRVLLKALSRIMCSDDFASKELVRSIFQYMDVSGALIGPLVAVEPSLHTSDPGVWSARALRASLAPVNIVLELALSRMDQVESPEHLVPCAASLLSSLVSYIAKTDTPGRTGSPHHHHTPVPTRPSTTTTTGGGRPAGEDMRALEYTQQLLLRTLTSASRAIHAPRKPSQGVQQSRGQVTQDDKKKKRKRREQEESMDESQGASLSSASVMCMADYVDVELVVRCIRASDNPQVHNDALLLLTEISRTDATLAMRNVLPIFVFMGATTLRKDDNYTFLVIQKTLAALLSPVVSGKQTQLVVSVLEIFIEALPAMPSHRRLPFFTMFVRIIGEEYLHAVVLLLLLARDDNNKHVKDRASLATLSPYLYEEQGKGEEEEEQNGESPPGAQDHLSLVGFAHQVSHQFAPTAVCWSFVKLAEEVGGSKGKELPRFLERMDTTTELLLGEKDQRTLEERKVMVLSYIVDHISSRPFLSSVLKSPTKEQVRLQQMYLLVFQQALQLVQQAEDGLHAAQEGAALASSGLKKAKKWAKKQRTKKKKKKKRRKSAGGKDPETLKTCLAEAKHAQQMYGTLGSLAEELVERLNSLMSVPAFTETVTALLKSQNPMIRRRGLLLFNEKVNEVDDFEEGGGLAGPFEATGRHQQEEEEEEDANAKVFLTLVEPLSTLVRTDEAPLNRQTALQTIEILCKRFGNSSAKAQKLFATTTTSLVIEAIRKESKQVSASALLCLGTHCRQLEARMVPTIGRFMPLVLSALRSSLVSSARGEKMQNTDKEQKEQEKVYQACVVSTLEAVISALHRFISPYISDIVQVVVSALSRCAAPKKKKKNHQGPVHEEVAGVLAKVVTLLAEKVETRLVLPAIYRAFPATCAAHITSVTQLLLFTKKVIQACETAAMPSHAPNLVKFYLQVFKHITAGAQLGSPGKNAIELSYSMIRQSMVAEDAALASVLALVLKLNETLFKPFFLKTLQWATTGPNDDTLPQWSPPLLRKRILMYHLVDSLAAKLEFIFTDYFELVVDDSISCLLLRPPAAWVSAASKPKIQLFCTLIKYVISGTHKFLKHDTSGQITSDRLEDLTDPLTDQLENTIGGAKLYTARMNKALIPCLTELAVRMGDVHKWRSLNHQVLLATRSEDPMVRYHALKVIDQFYLRLGEEFLVHLPETASFLVELMEDPNETVEKFAHKVLQRIDACLGPERSIQDYLS